MSSQLFLIPANDYKVFVRSSNSTMNGGIVGAHGYGGNLSLGNGIDELVMLFEGIEIDRVDYDSGTTFPSTAGSAMSLDPDEYGSGANDVGSNWCDAVGSFGSGDYGTPGAENSQCL